MKTTAASKVGTLLAMICVVLCVLALPNLALAESQADAPAPEFATLGELEGKTIGSLSASTMDRTVKSYAPAIDDFSYFNSYADMVGALTTGKIDGFVADEPTARLLVNRNEGITLLPEPVTKDRYGFVLAKGSPLTEKFSAVIREFREDGTLDKLKSIWCGADESAKVMPEQDWEAPNGTLRAAVDSANEPMGYIRDGNSVGYSIDLALRCCEKLGYHLEMRDMGFDALIASVQSNKVDIVCSSVSITDERRESMDFTDPIYDGAITIVVREAEGAARRAGFLQRLSSSFVRTFVVEGRWQMVASGLGVTLLISLSSGILGTLLGYAAMRWRNTGSRVAEKVINFCEILLGRLPIVVVLMVFYYVVFGAFDIPGIAVAIVVFTLSFGAGAEAVMWNAVSAVDPGQTEASLALGFSETETFRDVVFPQAMRHFVVLLQGNFITLVKDTSIVGFIAVTDLTRAGDLIRSRTMEAFFPLVAVAAIYFVACTLLAKGMAAVARRLDQTNRPRTIEGVEA